MEQLDLHGDLSSAWLTSYGGGQISDPVYLARVMLEPIIEETSDDDVDAAVSPELWSPYEQTWSSASDSGSVIRVEVNPADQDTISERDFACPAKRRRQDDANHHREDVVQLRKPKNDNIEFKFRIECVDSVADTFGKRYRLDEMTDPYSDCDNISFSSLSRSSSLIQFESLERQFQSDGLSSFGGSTPSLHSMQQHYDNPENHKSENPKQRYEINESKMVRNYYDVNKINFNQTGFLSAQQQNVRSHNSESSSSDNSLFSESHGSDNDVTVLKIPIQPTELMRKNITNYRCKNSAENLSEDSGYGEYVSLKIRSKSIPTFNSDNLIEEEEFEHHNKSVENVTFTRQHNQIHSNVDFCKTNASKDLDKYSIKIGTTKRHSAPCPNNNSMADAKNTPSASCSGKASQNISASLPNILDELDHDHYLSDCSATRNIRSRSSVLQFAASDRASCNGQDFSIVSSVPSDLNICPIDDDESLFFDSDRDWNSLNHRSGNGSTSRQSRTSVASKNFDLYDIDSSFVRTESFRQQKVINASYTNLTTLDYSGGSSLDSSFKKMADNRKRNSGEFSKCNFLLDEISAHFDRELSILNDQRENYDPVVKFIENEKIETVPPKPPPRKIHLQTKIYEEQCSINDESLTSVPSPNIVYSSPDVSPKPKYTFDRDPTNLVTCYAESLERCNFDLNASTTSISSTKNLDTCLLPTVKHSTPINRNFVSSTPNLNVCNVDETDHFMQAYSTHTSMNRLPQSDLGGDGGDRGVDKKPGILSIGSRTSLGKGVSFCPVVSEISWQEQSSEEFVDEDAQGYRDRSDDKQYHDQLPACQPSQQQQQQQKQHQHHEEQQHQHRPNTQNNNKSHLNDSRMSNVSETELKSQNERDSKQQRQSSSSSSSSNVNNNINRSNKTEPSLIGSSNTMIVNENVPLVVAPNIISGLSHRDSASGVEEFKQRSDQMMDNNNVKVGKPGAPQLMVGGRPDVTSSIDSCGAKSVSTKPEKKHKGGFLSRFSGFRFSLRSKKKPKLFESNKPAVTVSGGDPGNRDNNKVIVNKNNRNGDARKSIENQRNSVNTNGDFIYIPLKDPMVRKDNNTVNDATVHMNSAASPVVIDATNSIDNHMVVTTKPPLPRQPPRVVGVCAKPPPVPQSNGKTGRPASGHAQQRASSAPREIDDHHRISLLDHGVYRYNQFRSDMMTSSGADGDGPDGLDGGRIVGGGDSVIGGSSSQIIGADGCEYKIGLIETNLDTHETIISGKTRSLMELGPQMVSQRNNHHPGTVAYRVAAAVEPRRPHKSMEFLLDKENQKNILPPENELQKSHDNNVALSEHQLRVQASLQRLNIPEWYRQYSSTQKQPGDSPSSGGYVPGSFTKKRNSDIGRWTGLNSKTTSLSSLGSHRSDRSPLLLSPSAHSHHGQTGFSRWSTSHLNSSQTSPSASARSSFSRGGILNASILSSHSAGTQNNSSIRSSFRQPYMGWRSQEKLSQPRTPAERLASSLLSRQQPKQQVPQPEPVVTPEIQSSIKEVTSAIVHYVNDQTNRTSNSRSRSTSPTTRKCWLESSFVGNRPLDSPQTPVIQNSFTPRSSSGDTAALANRVNGVATPIPVLSVQSSDRPSPNSTTIDDVLASLLGLPTDSYRASGDTAAKKESSHHLQIEPNPVRRRSEGDAQKRMDASSHLRRISLDSSDSKHENEIVKCRYPKCDASTTQLEAKKNYKSCHNCSHMYCSRECRRSHWEKHRKACLHSRVSALCRQVLSACKDDADSLQYLSLMARRGFQSQGRGVVRILFRSAESAEMFVKQGFQFIGEATYVRWAELMPSEMGAELYQELLRLSTEYKTDSKMLVYVAICVVSEMPSMAVSSVKWERQLVSRCAKLKLSKQVQSECNPQPISSSSSAAAPEYHTDTLVLTFCTVKRGNNTKSREMILINIQHILKRRGVNLRKHFPEVFQRLNSFVEGMTDRFLPVTIHPRDTTTGRAFICIIMPNSGDSDKIKLPESDGGNSVQIIDCLEYIE